MMRLCEEKEEAGRIHMRGRTAAYLLRLFRLVSNPSLFFFKSGEETGVYKKRNVEGN